MKDIKRTSVSDCVSALPDPRPNAVSATPVAPTPPTAATPVPTSPLWLLGIIGAIEASAILTGPKGFSGEGERYEFSATSGLSGMII